MQIPESFLDFIPSLSCHFPRAIFRKKAINSSPSWLIVPSFLPALTEKLFSA